MVKGLRKGSAGLLCLVLWMASAQTSAAQGALWGWGNNNYGNLGNGNASNQYTPVQALGSGGMGNLTGIIAVAPTQFFTLALKGDGTVWAFGDNSNGNLGNNTMAASSTPVQVEDSTGMSYLTDIVQIAAAGELAVAVRSDGTVWTWGENYDGQLGNNSMVSNSSLPVQVVDATGMSFLTGITSVALWSDDMGDEYVLAVKNDGTLWGWGNNWNGVLGNGTDSNSILPVQVVGLNGMGNLTDVVQVAIGEQMSYALKSDGTVWAWGYGGNNELGNGATGNSSTPVQVVDSTGMSFLTDIISIASNMNADIAMALRSDGTVWAWGNNLGGTLGNGTDTGSNMPVQVLDAGDISGFLTNVTQIVVGFSTNLALKNDGTVRAWGYNYDGECGNGTVTQTGNDAIESPVEVLDPTGMGNLTGIVQILGGNQFYAALKNDGTAYVWGYGGDGEMGNGGNSNSDLPIQITGMTDVTSLVFPSDFADILMALTGGYRLAWQNFDSGDTWQWTMMGTNRVGGAEIQLGVAPNWYIAACADFNNGGNNDILWQNTSTGEVGYWAMTGGASGGYTQIAAPGALATQWRIRGAANFENLATPQLLVQNTSTGEVGLWMIVSGALGSYTQIMAPGVVGSGWQIVGTPDFLGNGSFEILWQNEITNEIGYWTLNDSYHWSSYTQIMAPWVVADGWQVVATADTTGDGESDIIWQNLDTGEVGCWTMSNGARVGYTQIIAPNIIGGAWQIGGAL